MLRIFIYFKGYLIAKDDTIVSEFFEKFCVYIKNKYCEECIRNYEKKFDYIVQMIHVH